MTCLDITSRQERRDMSSIFRTCWLSSVINDALPSVQNPLLILVVLLISGGLFMFTFESTQFNLEGFVMVLLASFLGGIRWTLTQVLMQKSELGECGGRPRRPAPSARLW